MAIPIIVYLLLGVMAFGAAPCMVLFL